MSIAATLRKCKRVIVDSDYRTNVLASLRVYNRLDDKKYLEKIFKANMGYALNLINPQTFNEKLQWLKLYNRRPEYTTMVDKYLVRDYIAEKFSLEDIHQGIRNKLPVLEEIKNKYSLKPDEIVYIGDDVNDIDCLKSVKYAITVKQANYKVKELPEVQITQAAAGDGAFREVVDNIVELKNYG